MPAVRAGWSPVIKPGLPSAAIAHAALLAWLASLAIRQFDPSPVAEQHIEVELQTPDEFEMRMRVPRPATLPAPLAPQLPPPGDVSPPLPHIEVDPRRLLSQRVLADPRSREARAMLSRLAPDERIEQLCGLEAMSQIHEWQRSFEPDRVTAYALSQTTLAGTVLKAEGAAFRSRRRWYRLRFACTVSPDLKSVAAFAFHVGEAIPVARWSALGLPAVH